MTIIRTPGNRGTFPGVPVAKGFSYVVHLLTHPYGERVSEMTPGNIGTPGNVPLFPGVANYSNSYPQAAVIA